MKATKSIFCVAVILYSPRSFIFIKWHCAICVIPFIFALMVIRVDTYSLFASKFCKLRFWSWQMKEKLVIRPFASLSDYLQTIQICMNTYIYYAKSVGHEEYHPHQTRKLPFSSRFRLRPVFWVSARKLLHHTLMQIMRSLAILLNYQHHHA